MIPIKGAIKGAAKTEAALRDFPSVMYDELNQTMLKLGLSLERRVKVKLSGEPLGLLPSGFPGIRGLLRSSIHLGMVHEPGVIMAVVGTSVDKVPYARIHEYGGTILPRRGMYLTFRTYDGSWRRVRKVEMPERSYLRSSLAEMAPVAQAEIGKAVDRAAQRSGFGK